MKIYLDNCCYFRPFDGYTYEKAVMETAVIEAAVTISKLAGYPIIGSPAVIAEMMEERDGAKRANAMGFYAEAADIIAEWTPDIDSRAQFFQMYGLKGMDHYHLAYAETLGADFLLTVDKRFINTCAREKLNTVNVLNPLYFLPEVIKWAQ